MRRALVTCLLTAACTIAPAPDGGPAPGGTDPLPPPGYGTLRQDEVSISLVSNDLQVLVTPLEPSVTLVTAPDTYERLAGIAAANRSATPAGSTLFLVSFYSDQPGTRFVPEDLHFLSRGFRVRPLVILPVTPGWGQRLLTQRETETAVYAFPSELAMDSDLVLVYDLDQSRAWQAILPRVQAEQARARARAGVGR